jgi:biotin-dependent carboxylase-like uncharacterized protein
MGEVRVIEPGLLTTIQDARGRPGLGRYGIPPGGALDAAAARLANRLVGNGGNEPVLEVTLRGPVLDWTGGAHIGLAGGDLGAVSAGLRLPPGHSYRLSAGATLRFDGARTGAPAYLAVEGGFEIAAVLGSTATDRRSGFGGLDGRALRAGDVLQFAAAQTGELRSLGSAHRPPDDPLLLRLIPTPSGLGWFAPSSIERLCATTWSVARDSDRNGLRLTGARLETSATGIPSLGVPVGSVQVPPSGEPIVTLVDGPVTGGYPVIGVVPCLDHGALAQAAPGARLRFRKISVAAARRLSAATAVEHDPDRIDLDDGEFAAGWAR